MPGQTIKVPSKLIEGSNLSKYADIQYNAICISVSLNKEFIKALLKDFLEIDSHIIHEIDCVVMDPNELLITINYDPKTLEKSLQ